MKQLLIPKYLSKEEVYTDLDKILSYIEREDVWLAHFKTPFFNQIENQYKTIEDSSMGSSIRNSDLCLDNYQIRVPMELEFKIATCIFSENRKTLGLKKHIHLPKTALNTITIAKKVFQGNDDVHFNFYRKNGPPNIHMTEDFVLRFDSTKLSHDITVPDSDQTIWLFTVFEHCKDDIDLEYIKNMFECEKIYDYAK